jgi:uncharacterized protein YqgV (UPF0045/DUF77 family)
VTAEFIVYPFIEGTDPPPHVRAAIDAVKASGLNVDVGPLSNTVVGDIGRVVGAIAAAQSAAISAGASRFVLNLEPTSAP